MKITKLFIATIVSCGLLINVYNDMFSVTKNNAFAEDSQSVEISWDGSVDTSWYDDEDTELYVFSAYELAGLAHLVNEGEKTFEGKTVYLENDIDLKGSKWIPIGIDESTCFRGNFDGQGHTISNLYCSSSNSYVGFFGYTMGCIKNVALENAAIYAVTSTSQVQNYKISGGICGILINGKIDNCKFTGKVDANSTANYATVYAGGLVGSLEDNSEIKNCHFEGSSKVSQIGVGGRYPVRNTASGGICGAQYGNSQIDSCSVNAKIYSFSAGYNEYRSYAGGICGASKGTLTIKNSYNLGEVESDSITYGASDTDKLHPSEHGISYAGGLIGLLSDSSTIENSYNVGNVIAYKNGGAVGELSTGAIINNVFYVTSSASKGTGVGEDTIIAKSSTNMKKEIFAENLGDKFVYIENSYPVLKWEVSENTTGVGLNDAKSVLNIGEEVQFSVTNYSGKVTWISSNTEAVKVSDSGIVTGVNEGTATIYAMLESGKSLSCIITVVNNSLKGDANNDGEINVADLVMLQNWILGRSNTLANWKNVTVKHPPSTKIQESRV